MKCERCEKKATVHLTEIKPGGVKQEMHLCEQCAAEMGLPGKTHFSISELLAGITSGAKKGQEQTAKEAHCKTCDQTLSQFQASGRFGCPDCYDNFRDDILPLVQKIHDTTQHVGKVPRRVTRSTSIQTEIRQLQLELKRTVKGEDYERAAQLRDQIKKLEDCLAEAGAVVGPARPPKAAPRAKDASKKKEDGEKSRGPS